MRVLERAVRIVCRHQMLGKRSALVLKGLKHLLRWLGSCGTTAAAAGRGRLVAFHNRIAANLLLDLGVGGSSDPRAQKRPCTILRNLQVGLVSRLKVDFGTKLVGIRLVKRLVGLPCQTLLAESSL